MLIDIHVRKDDGSPGPMIASIDAPKHLERVTVAGKEYEVLTGVRRFIVVPQSEVRAIKEFGL